MTDEIFVSGIAQEQLKMTAHGKQELHAMLPLVDEADAVISSPDRLLNEFGRLLYESESKKSHACELRFTTSN